MPNDTLFLYTDGVKELIDLSRHGGIRAVKEAPVW